MSALIKRVKVEAMKTLRSAMIAHEDGRWDDASDLYRWVIAVLPESANAWALNGLLKYQRGLKEDAAKFFAHALMIDPAQPIANNFFKDVGHPIKNSRRANSFCLDDHCVPKLFELSDKNLTDLRKDSAKETHEYDQIKSPKAREFLRSHFDFEKSERILEALVLLGATVELEPDSPYIRFRYGNLLGKLGRWDEAIEALSLVANANPLYGEVFNDRATIYFKQGKLDEAREDIKKAAILLPGNGQVHRNMGYVLVKSGDLAGGAVAYNRSLAIEPKNADTFNNLGMALEGMGRYEDATVFYEKAMEQNETLSLARWNRGLMYLRLGNLRKGWPLFEERWNTEMAGKERVYDFPLWDGSPLGSEKSVLIHYEQGLGDVIQFSRFINTELLRETQIVLEVQTPLVSLLAKNWPNVRVIQSMEGLARKYDHKIDCRCPIMSLPKIFNIDEDSITGADGYIQAPDEYIKKWNEKLGPKNHKFRVGISWSGRSSHNNDHNRSICLEDFKKIFCEGIEFHSLQVDYRDGDKEYISQQKSFFDHSNDISDFSDTAGLMENLDLIIAVDTSVAHLAGAIGKSVWILLPSWPDWRWMSNRCDTPWYSTARLFRQRYEDFDNKHPWLSVLERVREQLLRLRPSTVAIKPNLNLSSQKQKPGTEYVEKLLQSFKDVDNTDLAKVLKKIIHCFHDGNLGLAKDLSEDALGSFPKNTWLLTLLGYVCFELKEYETAERYINQSIGENNLQNEAFNLLGLIKLERGEEDEAEKVFEDLTANSPKFFDGFLNLGSVRYQKKDFLGAKNAFKNAVKIDTSDPHAHFNLGNTYKSLGQWDQAVEEYNRCLNFDPIYHQAYLNKASVYRQTDQDLKALKTYDEALRQNIKDLETLYFERAVVLTQLGRNEEAKLDLHRYIGTAAPDQSRTHQQKAHLLMLLEKSEDAIDSLNEALRIDPMNADCHHTQGRLMADAERWDEAEKSYSRAINIDPDRALFYANRGGTYIEKGDFKKGLADCEKGLKLYDHSADLYMNKAIALDQLDQDGALNCYDKAINLHPGHDLAHFNRSLLMLRSGHLEEGFKGYEHRWGTESFKRHEKKYPFKLWDGKSDLSDKIIFVHHEQGYGDSIQFCRYIKKLESISSKVVLGVPKPLVECMRSVSKTCDVVSTGTPVKRIDCCIPLMSLPHIFGTTLGNIPATVPYLMPDEQKRIKWRKKLSTTQKKRIGLVWSGRSKHKNDKNRSMSLEQLKRIVTPDAEFHSLQKDIRDYDHNTLMQSTNIIDHRESLIDFSETAALVSHLDLVISVDTSIVHLAGAIGVPVWVLLPFRPDWRWLDKGTTSPWYPTAELFRQNQKRDWDFVIQNLINSLSIYLNR